MENNNTKKKTITNVVRKLLKSRDISIKRAADYINCTEQSFRNKLSRDSFSIRDLIILCYICDARLMIDYCAYTDDYDMDFFNVSEYLTNEDLERVKKLEENYLMEDMIKWTISYGKSLTEEEFNNLSYEELGKLIKEQFHGKIAVIDSDADEEVEDEE